MNEFTFDFSLVYMGSYHIKTVVSCWGPVYIILFGFYET